MARYTKEQSDAIVAAYKIKPDAETVNTLAETFKVPTRSIIAKLSSLGVYERKRYVSKSGLPPIKKATLADELGKILGLHDFEIEQLEKLSKPLITKLIEKYNENTRA